MKTFWFFTKFWLYSFVQNLIFKWVFCFIQNVAFSACLKVMHIAWKVKVSKQYVQQFVLTQFVNGSELFYGFIAKNCQKNVSSSFADSCNYFLSNSTKNIPGLCDGHCIAWISSSGRFQVTLGRGKVVRLMYSSDVEQFFLQFVLPSAMIYYDSHHLYVSIKHGLLGRFLFPDFWSFS